MVSKRKAIACNKHVNDNVKRWEAASGTPTIVIIKITRVIPIIIKESLAPLNLPARLLFQVQEVVRTPV